MSGRDRFAAYRERLEAMGFRPSRNLGQNFLLDPTLHEAIADAIDLGPGDQVLEIGAGLGFLTRCLARRARRVLAVEIDDRLARVLRQELEKMEGGERVELLEADALDGDRLHPEIAERLEPGPYAVVANLPYRVAGPLMAALMASETLPERMVVLVQRELAERLAAAPGTKTYGGLTAFVGSCYHSRIGRKVGREVFRPRPQVDSALWVATKRGRDAPAAGLEPAERKAFGRFLRHVFAERRKKLRNAVPGPWPEKLPALLADRRAGELDPDQLLALWRAFPSEPRS